MKRALPLLAVLALAGCSSSIDPATVDAAAETTPTGPTLDGAAEVCELADSTLMDDGQTLMLDGEGDDDRGSAAGTLSVEEIGCALSELETADATITKMGNTRALDGMQSDSDENFEYTWTYHPDDGLDVIITAMTD